MKWALSSAESRRDRRRSQDVDATVARSHKTSAELLALIDNIRAQVADLSRDIEVWLVDNERSFTGGA